VGIQSTRTITREQAIHRIGRITNFVRAGNWRALEADSQELSINPMKHEFELPEGDINFWVNRSLEEIMDQPFFRFSMFENYFIED